MDILYYNFYQCQILCVLRSVYCYVSFSVMQAIVSSIMMNDVVNPIKLLLNERRKQKSLGKARFRSMYREIMYLSLVALGRNNIDCGKCTLKYVINFVIVQYFVEVNFILLNSYSGASANILNLFILITKQFIYASKCKKTPLSIIYWAQKI